MIHLPCLTLDTPYRIASNHIFYRNPSFLQRSKYTIDEQRRLSMLFFFTERLELPNPKVEITRHFLFGNKT